MSNQHRFNKEVTRRFANVMIDPQLGCAELRIFHAQFNYKLGTIIHGERNYTIGGWFNDVNYLINHLARVKDISCYMAVNPVPNRFLLSCQNDLKVFKGKAASNKESVEYITSLYIDIDSIRHPGDISATDEELALAIARRDAILEDFPDLAASSLWGCSGNGAYIVGKIRTLPNITDSVDLVENCIRRVSSKYSDNLVNIDVKVRDPSRVMCVPGTMKCKGKPSEERPWRMVTIDGGIACGDGITYTPLELADWYTRHFKPSKSSKPTQPARPTKPISANAAPPSHAPPRTLPREAARHPGEGEKGDDLARVLERAEQYIYGQGFEDSVQGQDGSGRFFYVACCLVQGFDLSLDDAFPIAKRWSETKSIPPWSDEEIRHKLEDAGKRQGNKPRGYLKDAHKPGYGPDEDHRKPAVEGPNEVPDEIPPGNEVPNEIDNDRIKDLINNIIDSKSFDNLISNNELLFLLARLELTDYQGFAIWHAHLKRRLGRVFSENVFQRVMKPIREALKPPNQGRDGDRDISGSEDDPHRLARLYLDQMHSHTDGVTLRFWREEYHAWNGSCYRVVPPKELRGRITSTVADEFQRIFEEKLAIEGAENSEPVRLHPVTTRLMGDVIQAIESCTLMEVSKYENQPAWINPEKVTWPASEVIVSKDAMLHVPSFADRKTPYIAPSTPNLFSPFAVNYTFDPDAPSPGRFLNFLESIWGSDYESIEAIQEWFGYFLLPDTSQQKLLMIIGPKRSGKGTLARLLTRLVGEANVCYPTFFDLGMPFGLSPLVGKSVAIISDARISGRTDIAPVIERLLSITGEDGQNINRKYMKTITMRLPTRFMILSNEIPKLAESSGALVGRSVILRMRRSFFGEEDLKLEHELAKQLPGILLWAIEGWKRLRDRGYFVQPHSGVPLIDEMGDMNSPIGAFVKENCLIDPDEETDVDRLFLEWREWCGRNNRDHPGDKQTFGRNLRSIVPDLETGQRGSGKDRVRVFKGIAFLGIYKDDLLQARTQPSGNGNGHVSDEDTPF